MKRIGCPFIALLMALSLLSACQPTPEEGFVVDRQDGALEEAIAATPAPAARYEAPQRWQETFEVRGQTVREAAGEMGVVARRVEQMQTAAIRALPLRGAARGAKTAKDGEKGGETP